MATSHIRHILQGLCAVLIAVLALGCAPPSAVVQTPPPAATQTQAALPRTVEGVTFGPEASLLFLTPEQQRVAYRNLKLLAPHNPVPRGKVVSPLPQATMDLKDFTYSYQDRARSLDDFLTETRVAGFLV